MVDRQTQMPRDVTQGSRDGRLAGGVMAVLIVAVHLTPRGDWLYLVLLTAL